MRAFSCLLAIALLLSGCRPGLVEYDLDAASIDAGTLSQLETVSGFPLPEGAIGLNYHYSPPIDPVYIAKIEAPVESKASLVSQIEQLSSAPFQDDFASDRCAWWPRSFENSVVSKQARPDGHYLEVHLMEESQRLVLYIKFFTA